MLSLQKAMIYPPDIPTSNPLEESRQKSEEKVKRFRRIQEGIDDAATAVTRSTIYCVISHRLLRNRLPPTAPIHDFWFITIVTEISYAPKKSLKFNLPLFLASSFLSSLLVVTSHQHSLLSQ